eukprot:m.29044 g.29044  ORF g.29044 m.29044 type:complete len:251 (+) comp16029_c0_seq1:265-1017(+)
MSVGIALLYVVVGLTLIFLICFGYVVRMNWSPKSYVEDGTRAHDIVAKAAIQFLVNAQPHERRVVVMGVSGAGKSTLAESIAAMFQMHFGNVDEIQFVARGGNWKTYSREEKARRWKAAMVQGAGVGWAFDGILSKERDTVVDRINVLIHLDYTYPTVLSRLLPRSFWRVVTQERLWGTDNYEQASNVLKFWDIHASILAWQAMRFGSYRSEGKRNMRELGATMVLDFRRPSDTDAWMDALKSALNNKTT